MHNITITYAYTRYALGEETNSTRPGRMSTLSIYIYIYICKLHVYIYIYIACVTLLYYMTTTRLCVVYIYIYIYIHISTLISYGLDVTVSMWCLRRARGKIQRRNCPHHRRVRQCWSALEGRGPTRWVKLPLCSL